jgi:hypothetical protein
MTQIQLEQDLSIIKNMIEKTRRETAESGYLFIIPGILCILTVLIMSRLEAFALSHLARPIFLGLLGLIAATSAWIGIREGRKTRVQTYAKTIFAHLWIAVGVVCLIVGVLLPLLNVFPWSSQPVISFFVLGIGIYLTGVIYEIPGIKWCGVVWWLGAFILAFVTGPKRIALIIAIIVLGYILPGILLARQSKHRSQTDESR